LQKQPFTIFSEPHDSIRTKLSSLEGKEEKLPGMKIIQGTVQRKSEWERRMERTTYIRLSVPVTH